MGFKRSWLQKALKPMYLSAKTEYSLEYLQVHFLFAALHMGFKRYWLYEALKHMYLSAKTDPESRNIVQQCLKPMCIASTIDEKVSTRASTTL